MRDLTKGNIHKAFLAYSIPVIISSVLSMSFGIINTSIAGIYLGAKGIAATTATADFFNITNAIIWGYNMGISIYIAGIFAARKYKLLKKIVNTNLFVSTAFAALIGISGIIFNVPLLNFLNIDKEIIADTRLYFIFMCVYMPISIATHFYHNALNAMGETKFPLYVSVINSVINISGNFLTVAIFKIGILGICISTTVGGLVALTAYYAKFKICFSELGVAKYKFKMRPLYITSLFSYSLPCAFQQVSLYTANFFMSPIKNGLGYIAVAANSLAGRIIDINTTVYGASTKAGGQYIAQCVGAQKYGKIKKAVWVTLLHGALLFMPIMILICYFPTFTCSLFMDIEEEPEVYEYVMIFIRYFLPFIMGNMICSSFHSILRGVKSTAHLIISSLTGSVARLIISCIFVGSYGVIGLFIGTALAPIFEVIYIAVIYFTGLWIPKNIRSLILKKKAQN